MRSEYDYQHKKKFTDVLGQPNQATRLARLANEQNAQGEASLKSSTYKSRVSQRSTISQKNPKAQAVVDQMPVTSTEEATNKLVNELIGTL